MIVAQCGRRKEGELVTESSLEKVGVVGIKEWPHLSHSARVYEGRLPFVDSFALFNAWGRIGLDL